MTKKYRGRKETKTNETRARHPAIKKKSLCKRKHAAEGQYTKHTFKK